MTDDELKRLLEEHAMETQWQNHDVCGDTRRHSELDRRIRTLEEGLADLQARVERLETSTH